jgi:DnaB-like helicase C terminal domain
MNVRPLIYRAVGLLEEWYMARGFRPRYPPPRCLVDRSGLGTDWSDPWPSLVPHRLALQAAIDRRQHVAVACLAAPAQAVLLRMFLDRAQVPLERAQSGTLKDPEFARLVLTAGELSLARLLFLEQEELAPQRPYGGLAPLLREFPVELIVVMNPAAGAPGLDRESVWQFAALRGCRALYFTH